MPDDLDDVSIPDDLDELDDTLDIDEVEGDADDIGDVIDELGDDSDDLDHGAELDTDLDAAIEPEEEDKVPIDTIERPIDEPDEDDDDELDEEDVEASLDVILKERLVVVDDEPDDDEAPDVEDRSEMGERVLPKQPDEFVCRSCFLVKHPSQLADKDRMLCRDCV
jgi:hypothetical protein